MATVLEKGLVEKAIKIKLRNTIHNSLDLIRDDINKLEVLFQKNSPHAVIADDITRIQRLVDELNECQITRNINLIVDKLEEIFAHIKRFNKKHQESISNEIFVRLGEAIDFCKQELQRFNAIEEACKALQSCEMLSENSSKNLLEIWSNSLELFAEFLEEDPAFFSDELLKDLNKLSKVVLDVTAKSNYTTSKRKLIYRRRIRLAANLLVHLTEQKQLDLSLQGEPKENIQQEQKEDENELTEAPLSLSESLDRSNHGSTVEAAEDPALPYINDAWVLSGEDAALFLEIVENPPEPSDALLSVFR